MRKGYFFPIILLTFICLPVMVVSQNYSLHLDGSGDYVSVSNAPIFNWGVEDYTVALWVKKLGTNNIQQIVCKEILSPYTGWYLRFINNRVQFVPGVTVKNQTWINNGNIMSNTTIQNNMWYYIAAVFNGSQGTVSIFINGQQDTLGVASTTVNPDNNSDLMFGVYQPSGAPSGPEYLNGIIDEVSIWNYALSQGEINSIMNSQLNGEEDGLVGYWRFNEGTGSIVNDATVNGNNGTIYGNGIWSTDVPNQVFTNYSLSFDGYYDYVNIDFPSSFNVNPNESYTFECWVLSRNDIFANLITNRSQSTNEAPYYTVGLGYDPNNPTESLMFEWRYSSVGVSNHEAVTVSDSTWHHIALVRNINTNKIELYLDGNLVIQNDDPDTNSTISTNSPLQIGGWTGPGWNGPGGRQVEFLNGNIDEVRISNTVRYTTGFIPSTEYIPDSFTIALYHFNEGYGDTVYDASGNNLHGVIFGETNWSSSYPVVDVTLDSLLWSVRLQANMGDYNDVDNYLGVSGGATNVFDASYDEVEPPESLGNYVQLYFPHPEWDNPFGDKLSKDIRPDIDLTDTMQVWDFEVLSNISGEVTITFILTDVPNIPVILENTATGERQTLTNNATYTFSSVADSAHPFRISIGDTTPPFLTLGTNCSGPAILNSDSIRTLNWTTFDGYSVDSIEVWFSADSGTTYSKVVSLGAVGSYDWTVPDTTIVYHGFLKIMSKDYAGNVAEKLSDYIFTIVGDSISTTVTSGWNLWSSPIDPANDTMTANLDDDFTDYWVTYNYVNNGYTYNGILKETEGYWLGTVQNATIDVKGTALTSDHTMTLSQGWDLVSNPLVLDVSVDSLEFTKDGVTKDYSDAISTGWVNSIYGYSNSGYETTTTLLPWKGYWIGVLETNLSMTFPIHRKPASRSTRTRDYGWFIAFEAQASNSNDRTLVIGIDEMATNGFDNAFDAVRPPNPPGPEYISLFISHPEWNYFLGDKFSKDIRGGIPENGFQEWHVETEATEDNIELSWSLHGVPDELELGIDLNNDGNFSDMRILENVSLESNASFVVRVGIGVLKVTDQIVPLSFALYQNYPNPFNPSTSIQYDLPERAHVNLVIYSLLGRQIITLVDQTQEPGHKSVIWDASNVSSGIYIYHIEAGSFTQTRKMVLLK